MPSNDLAVDEAGCLTQLRRPAGDEHALDPGGAQVGDRSGAVLGVPAAAGREDGHRSTRSSTARMPPAARRLVTKACRAPKSRRVPRVRTTTPASPSARARSRSRSNAVASRRGARHPVRAAGATRGRRSSGLVGRGEHRHAREGAAAGGEVALALGGRVGDPLVQQTGGEGAHGAAGALDLLEAAPTPRAATSSVRDSRYQEPPPGSVTRPTLDSSARRIWVLRASRRPNRSGRPATRVVGQHGDGVGAAEGRAEGREGAAQHVDPRVLAGEHPQARHGVGAGTALVLGDAGRLTDPGPDPAQRPQGGGGEELVGGGPDPELELAERLGAGTPAASRWRR